jgi:hypothetical protein
MDKDMSSISNKIKQKVKTPTNKTIQVEKASYEQETLEFKVRNVLDSPKIKSNDNNYIPDFTSNYYLPHGISTLNINFPTCYHDRRPTPLQMSSR